MCLISIAPEVLLAIVILITGWIFTLVYDYYTEKSRLKERSEYFVKSVESILAEILTQADKYEEVTEDISDINNTRYKLKTVTGLNFHFYQPNIVEDIHSYLSKSKDNAHTIIKDITSSINGIKVQLQNFKHNFTQFRELQSENYKNWHSEVSSLLNEYDKLFEEDVENGEITKEVGNIRELIGKYLEQNNESVEFTTKNLIIPIKNYCDEAGNIRLINIKRFAHGAINFFENMESNIEHYTELFEKDAEQAREHHGKLSTSVETINSVL